MSWSERLALDLDLPLVPDCELRFERVEPLLELERLVLALERLLFELEFLDFCPDFAARDREVACAIGLSPDASVPWTRLRMSGFAPAFTHAGGSDAFSGFPIRTSGHASPAMRLTICAD